MSLPPEPPCVFVSYSRQRSPQIGRCINDASKIQAIAYGEVCVSHDTVEAVGFDGINLSGKEIPKKALRIDSEDLIAALRAA